MFRDAIERLAPYVPGEQPRPGERLLKLNTNENPYPPSPRVRRAVSGAAASRTLRLYPSPTAEEFVAGASRLYGIPPAEILAGNGSDELLAMVFRVALDPGDTVAYPVPTYSLYDTLAAIQGATVKAIPFARDFAVPFDALAKIRARLTIVCNPNSPSATIAPVEALERLACHLSPRLLLIDEAYVDFADTNALCLVNRCRNVVILRSLSKSFSLAGVRLGLCFAHRAIIQTLLKVKDSYNVSRLAIAAGVAALEDVAWMQRNVARVRKTRENTERALRRIGFEVPRSSANFVLARLPGRNLAAMWSSLRRRGILVRYFDTPSLRDSLRISIGTRKEMRTLLNELKVLIKQTPNRRTA